MFLLAGIAKFLFIPLAEAVVFAMLASYMLSRTLVPTLAKFWLKKHDCQARKQPRTPGALSGALRTRLRALARALPRAARHGACTAAPRFAAYFPGRMAATALLAFPLGPLPGLGQDFFPTVDGGQIKLHLRARTGTRIEETAALCDRVESDDPRESFPPSRSAASSTTWVCPTAASISPTAPRRRWARAMRTSTSTCTEDHKPTARIRARAANQTGARPIRRRNFAFLPADMIGQILNFGLPSPIDVQIVGVNVAGQPRIRQRAAAETAQHPGRGGSAHSAVRATIRSSTSMSTASKAQLLGLTEQTVAEQHAGVAVGQLPDLARPSGSTRKAERNTMSRPRLRNTASRTSMISAIRR